MYRVLFMPLLQIPSGHHQVADSIQEELNQYQNTFQCEKVEILSYCYGNLETLISKIYLKWIHKFPQLYSSVYKNMAVKNPKMNRGVMAYQWLFLKKIRQLLCESNPDVIICTHAFPSYLINDLKKKKAFSGKVINVYTDYFVNNLWGIQHIDYHFVPCQHVKEQLIRRGVEEDRISISGIPVHPVFKAPKPSRKENKIVVLISGGNLGVGSILQLIERLNPSGTIQYKVLCGKNKLLYDYLSQLNHAHICPVTYIDSKEEMNNLYEEATAILTKPGGVTITECLRKRLPIFVYEALPGQEEYNLNILKEQGLVFHLDNWNTSVNIEKRIHESLSKEVKHFYHQVDAFYQTIEVDHPSSIIKNVVSRH